MWSTRAIPTPGHDVYRPDRRGEWLAKLDERGVRFRAASLSRQLDVLKEIRQEAKAAMLAEARKDPAWERLLGTPYLGPVRVALLLAVLQTPVCRGTRLTLGPLAEPEEASGQPKAESQIEPWFAVLRSQDAESTVRTEPELKQEVTDAEED